MSQDCGGATTLTLSKEQTALLMPVLQQMIQNNPGVDDGKGKNATELPEDHPTSYQQTSGANDGSFDEPPIPPEGSAAGVHSEDEAFLDSSSYSVEELLCKKKKNQKSTQAQCYFSVSLVIQ